MKLSKINKKSVFYNLAAIAISNTILQTMGFLYRIFLSRMTGAEGLGVYQLIMPFYSVLSSLTLSGVTVAVARISASKSSVGDHIGARRAVSLSRRVFIFGVIVLAAITLSFRDTVAGGILGDSRTLQSLPFIFICLFLTGLENILKNYFYGVGRVAPQIASELSEQIIRASAVAALLIYFSPSDAGISAMLIIIGMVISELFSSSLLSCFYKKSKKEHSRAVTKPTKVRDILAISLPVSAAATVNNLLSSLNALLIPRRLIASGLSSRAATESFGVLFGMTMPLLSFPIAFIASLTSVMIPKISEKHATGDFSEMRRKAGKTIHATSLLAMPCMAILIPLGKPVCELLFSHSEAGNFMLPLCIATLFSYYELSTGALLNGIGLQKQAAVYIVIGGILQLGFTWLVGVPQIGMLGYVYGYLISSALTALLNFFCLVKKLRLRPGYVNWFLSPLLCSTLTALICDITYDVLYTSTSSFHTALILSAVSGIAAYAISLSSLGTNIFRYIKTLIPKESDIRSLR